VIAQIRVRRLTTCGKPTSCSYRSDGSSIIDVLEDTGSEPQPRMALRRRARVWVQKNRAISVIIGLTCAFGLAVVILAEVEGEDISTFYSGMTLVASFAILSAAVAAAIYAKPGYDAVIAQRQPSNLEIADITIRDSGLEELTPVAIADSLVTDRGEPIDVFEARVGSTIHLTVSIYNAGTIPAHIVWNLNVPAVCGLDPTDHPGLAHYLGTPRDYSIGENAVLTRLSVSRYELPAHVTVGFHADITLPDVLCDEADGWPMEAKVVGESDWRSSLQRSIWFVRTIQ
jgi:hypothetical protein